MLAKRNKIAEEDRITAVLKKGKRTRGIFIQIACLTGIKSHSRFCAIVSKKLAKKAIERNRLRRRIYEIIRLNWNRLPQKCYDVVVLCRHSAMKTDKSALEKDFIYCINKIKNG